MKRLIGVAAACIFVGVISVARADTTALPPATNAAAAPISETASTHRVGDSFDYTVHGSMSQTILANDSDGKRIDQPGMPTALDG
ncbi:MAG: hypothetical protein JO347_07130, partial [Candidatus Eremiobacteraeota bacterium]|nr:hypothetical protein [Candidatus Eremiobacteraeota bacterium]